MAIYLQIDLMARGASIVLFLLWSWILLRDHRNILSARLAVLMNCAIIGYVLATLPLTYSTNPARIFCSIVAGSTPGLFWMFARTWFNDRQHLERWAVAIVALSVVNIIVMQLTFGGPLANVELSSLIFRVGMFAFAAAGLWEAWRGRDGDLVESRRRMRPRIVAAVGFSVILIAIVEIAVYNLHAPEWIARALGTGIALITMPFCAALFSMRESSLFGQIQRSTAQAPLPVDEVLQQRLLDHMRLELPHRNEDMTISRLAGQLGEQEYRLRRHINGALGYRNFAAFLNGYRLDEVKAALVDPTQKDVPIITIALDAGFGSLGPFNRAFREAEGMTPSEYRAA